MDKNKEESIENEVKCQLNKMNQSEKLDKAVVSLAKIEEHLRQLNGSVSDHEGRLRLAETRIYLAMGGILVVGVLGGLKVIGLW